jgi:hypothetical protein
MLACDKHAELSLAVHAQCNINAMSYAQLARGDACPLPTRMPDSPVTNMLSCDWQ